MKDNLIDQLVADLNPVTPLANHRLWLYCAGCLFVILILILSVLGLRHDYARAVETGAMFWKPGLFFLAALGTIFLVTDISRPGGRVKWGHLAPLLLAAALLIWQFSFQMTRYPPGFLLDSLLDRSAFLCLSVISIGGGAIMGLTWKFWHSRTASPRPALLGMLSGFGAGCLAATAYGLHCDKDTASYISAYYGLPILMLSVIGGILGSKFLRW
ncbi:MAG: hypothetical protein CMN55_06770 [Sneathiella sp.]|jgi:hypothetical protein|uniref:DUF1109 domain-containing protein n=1 Tax=Sneathiella sp. TaxID=1964365 RepID=UPI000C54E4C4|nr:DUF1109 domain-containing protein [Sneathiella sp.]MAL78806.1 hypothetical protein [Sneathiella sp.]|tara:strand:+ start:279 stop:920 length:642 start_codon:yes stop_codon:yes gene_type:complete